MLDSTRGPIPGELLARLYLRGLLRQPEVAVTEAITWLCSLPGASHALDRLIRDAGLDPIGEIAWYAEVPAADRTRTDIEAWWGEPAVPRVVIEAKLGHILTVEQVAAYVTDLRGRISESQGSREGLVVVLVPEHRHSEAATVLSQMAADPDRVSGGPAIHTAVWSYDQVLDALGATLGAGGDVAQLRGLVEVCAALAIRPIAPADLTMASSARVEDVTRVVDLASEALFGGARTLPSGSDEDFSWRRYIDPVPGTSIAVGVRRPKSHGNRQPAPWTWIRVHATTGQAAVAGKAITDGWSSAGAYTDAAGHTWLPLSVPESVSGASMVEEVTRQAEQVLSAVRSALE